MRLPSKGSAAGTKKSFERALAHSFLAAYSRPYFKEGAELDEQELGSEIGKIADALPPGWSHEVRPGKYPLWMVQVDFESPGIDCVIRFGRDGQQSRVEHPSLTLYFYKIEDREKLEKLEEPFMELSSRCPMDLLLAETSTYTIAVSPCHQAYTADKTCVPHRDELKATLKKFFESFG